MFAPSLLCILGLVIMSTGGFISSSNLLIFNIFGFALIALGVIVEIIGIGGLLADIAYTLMPKLFTREEKNGLNREQRRKLVKHKK